MNMIPPNGVDENLWMYLPYFNRLKPGDNVQLRDGTSGTIIEVSPDRHTLQVVLNGGRKVVCNKKEVVRVAQ
jgi:preprotein translocase subunit YajC